MPRPILVLLVTLIGASPSHGQIVRLPHADTTRSNFFGVAVAIEGYRAIVGASGEDSCGANAGATYVFEREDADGAWRQTARLAPSVCIPGEFFGRSVALSGNRVLVAASAEFFASQASNAAYLFEIDGNGTWRQHARLTVNTGPEEGAFASGVALDGDRAVITTGGDPSDDRYAGAAYVFEPDSTGQWRQVARLTGSGGLKHGVFGGAVALDGDYIAVAASTYFRNEPGSVYLFERDAETGGWLEKARFGGIDDFFISLSLDQDRLLVGESKAGRQGAGMASIFTRSASGIWKASGSMHPSTPYAQGGFGTAVALSGKYALIAGYDEQLGNDFNIDRVVYVFAQSAATEEWTQQHVIDIGEVAFGTSMALDGMRALIGRASENEPGAAYVVEIR